MTSRSFPSSPNTSFLTKTRVLFIILTISASLVILSSILYFIYHLWQSIVHRAKTIPLFDSNTPLKLHRFSYRELKIATRDFNSSNVIGKGGSGTVFKGTLTTGKLVAIKRLDSNSCSLQSEREFQNELQILGGLRSPFLVTLIGYCVENKNHHKMLIFDYMPNKSLQESLFFEDDQEHDGNNNIMSWEKRFEVVFDVAKALEFLHLVCEPPVIHGDIKPSNVLLDSDHRAKISDFGLSRVKTEGEFGNNNNMFSQELSGNLTAEISEEVDFSLALQASSSSKHNPSNVKPLSGDWSNEKYEDDYDNHSKELMIGSEANNKEEEQQWGKDWWWRQDSTNNNEVKSKDYVSEWIGTQICPKPEPEEEDEDEEEVCRKKPRKMQEWWREEHIEEEITNKNKNKKIKKCFFKRLISEKMKKKKSEKEMSNNNNGEFSFRRGWRINNFKLNNINKTNKESVIGSEELFSRELSSTTSMRGTLCYVAPEYGGSGFLQEKADIYSFGVLILVIVSGRRPLHVLASPMKLEKANLISWCRHLALTGDVLEAVDHRLNADFDKEQASLLIGLALSCLQKSPEFRPDIGDILRVLRGDLDLSSVPFDFSPSPPPSSSRFFSRSTRNHKSSPQL